MCSPTKTGNAVGLEVLDPKLKLYEPPFEKRFEGPIWLFYRGNP